MPSRAHVRITRAAISPRLATSSRRILIALASPSPAEPEAGSTTRSTASASANSPLTARNSTTVPRTPACTGVIIFMVSMTPTTVSSRTWSPTSTYGGAPGFGAR